MGEPEPSKFELMVTQMYLDCSDKNWKPLSHRDEGWGANPKASVQDLPAKTGTCKPKCDKKI